MSNCHTPHAQCVESPPLPQIQVNGVLIDESLYAQELQYHQADSLDLVLQKAGQALVIRQLLLNELGAIEEADQEQAVAELVERNGIAQEPSEQDCVRYFENNRERFKTEPLLHVDHILLVAPQDDLEERSRAKEKAYVIIEQLKADPKFFASLAEQHSACPSKKMGGSLGQIGKGQTVPEFEKQIMRLPARLAEVPIESRYGFHVVRINRKIEGKPLEYIMVAEKIKHYLTQKSSHLSIQAYIQSLVEQATIKGIKISFANENIVV